MSALHFLVPVLLMFILSIASTEILPLTSFGQLLKNALPKETYHIMFGFEVRDQAEFMKEVATYTDTFAKTLGQKTPPELAKEFEAEAKRVANIISPKSPNIIFAIFSNALSNTLQDQKKLTPVNQDKLVKKLVEQLKKTADSVKTEGTFPIITALSNTAAEFFKFLDLSSQDVLVNYEENLLAEDKKL